MRFKVLLEKDEDGFVVATVPSLPGCVSQGKSEADALRNIREAISLHVSQPCGHCAGDVEGHNEIGKPGP
ncbi:MAG: type II toxin-antitoxin system HicB family antitoxin [Candidatus Micrarchaeota archaeon]